jgi:hypothetical protein
MILTLITTNTESGDAVSEFTSGINSTYDEYMFVYTNMNPATDNTRFRFQASTDGGSSWGVSFTTTYFHATHTEGGSQTFGYQSGEDQQANTSYQALTKLQGNGSDDCTDGVLHLFTPSNTTYVTHFYARSLGTGTTSANTALDVWTAGYWNTATAIDGIRFEMDSGNMDGVIQMFGVA